VNIIKIEKAIGLGKIHTQWKLREIKEAGNDDLFARPHHDAAFRRDRVATSNHHSVIFQVLPHNSWGVAAK
jgi:hypothetical protein